MSAPAASPARQSVNLQDIRQVRRGVAEAGDAQLLQVVRVVDAMEERGATDEVLAPVRARLRQIQPARPLRFARLLFLPADRLIVAPAAWRPGSSFLPRHALAVLSAAVRAQLRAADLDAGTDMLGRVDTLIRSATTAQIGVVGQAGALLWHRAAGILTRLAQAPPADCLAAWLAAGLPAAELAPLAGAVSALLAPAGALHAHEHGGPILADQDLVGLLGEAASAGARAWCMLLSLLLIRMPQAGAVLLAAAATNRPACAASSVATEAALAWAEEASTAQPEVIGPDAALELSSQATLLDTLSTQLGDAESRRRLARIRGKLQEGALHRLDVSFQERVAVALGALPTTPADRDAALDRVEAATRTLRAFELEARRLGDHPRLDALVERTCRLVSNVPATSAMDRARLVEIIAGPDAATRFLKQA